MQQKGAISSTPYGKSPSYADVVRSPDTQNQFYGPPRSDLDPRVGTYDNTAFVSSQGVDIDRPVDTSVKVTQDEGKTGGRDRWASKMEFLLSVIGFAVDLGNIWRFPYICYRNGGGAFLIAYIIMYVFGGLPMFYLELLIGQYHGCGAISIWEKIFPLIKGIGFGMVTISFVVGTYYEVIIAWAFYFLFDSFRSHVPWDTCSASWNTENCLQTAIAFNVSRYNGTVSSNVTSSTFEYFFRGVLRVQEGDGLARLGSLTWQLPLCLLLVKGIIYFSLFKGVTASGKVVYFTAIMPYIMLTILLVRTALLSGSYDGILYYLTPKWERLKDPTVWTDAAAQVYFSLGPGFGVLLSFASYNKFHNRVIRDAVISSVINCLTSFFAGFTVFSVLGYMAAGLNQKVEDVASSADGPALVFIAYPEAISTLPVAPLWAILFFIMVITLGLDSSFGGNEGIVTAVMDHWPNAFKKREYFLILLVGSTYLLGIPNMTAGGYYLLTLMDFHTAPISILLIAFFEVAAVAWVYDIRKFSLDIAEMTGSGPCMGWKILWAGITPLFLLMRDCRIIGRLWLRVCRWQHTFIECTNRIIRKLRKRSPDFRNKESKKKTTEFMKARGEVFSSSIYPGSRNETSQYANFQLKITF